MVFCCFNEFSKKTEVAISKFLHIARVEKLLGRDLSFHKVLATFFVRRDRRSRLSNKKVDSTL